MTTAEAINTLRIAIAEVEWEYPMNYAVALEMAIEALQTNEMLRERLRWYESQKGQA